MNPSVQSRLLASGFAFVLGFAIANYGLLMVARPDQWLWLIAAAIFMGTAGIGVVFADSSSAFSVWTVIGFELLVGFTLVPFAWLVSLALAPAGSAPLTLWPQEPSMAALRDAFGSSQLRHGVANSIIIAGASTLIAVVISATAAYALVRFKFRGKRLVYGIVLGALFMPVFVLAGPLADQAFAFGLFDTKRMLIVGYLAITIPLSLWLFVSLFAQTHWSLRDAARADGATRWQLARKVDLRMFGPGIIAASLIVFFIACNDLVLGLALSTTDSAMPFPATLAALDRTAADSSTAVAAAGLLWFLPTLIFILVFQRTIVWLLGRPNR